MGRQIPVTRDSLEKGAIFEIPRVHAAAVLLIAVWNSVYGLCNISTSNLRSYKGREMVCGSAVGGQNPVTRDSSEKDAIFSNLLVSVLPLCG